MCADLLSFLLVKRCLQEHPTKFAVSNDLPRIREISREFVNTIRDIKKRRHTNNPHKNGNLFTILNTSEIRYRFETFFCLSRIEMWLESCVHPYRNRTHVRMYRKFSLIYTLQQLNSKKAPCTLVSTDINIVAVLKIVEIGMVDEIGAKALG